MPPSIVLRPEELPQSVAVGTLYRLGRNFISAVRAAVRLLKPLFDAVISKDVFALG
jgi:hypothetical protein